jgi:hypothetical protein
MELQVPTPMRTLAGQTGKVRRVAGERSDHDSGEESTHATRSGKAASRRRRGPGDAGTPPRPFKLSWNRHCMASPSPSIYRGMHMLSMWPWCHVRAFHQSPCSRNRAHGADRDSDTSKRKTAWVDAHWSRCRCLVGCGRARLQRIARCFVFWFDKLIYMSVTYCKVISLSIISNWYINDEIISLPIIDEAMMHRSSPLGPRRLARAQPSRVHTRHD